MLKNGVPFDLIDVMDDDELMARCIIFGELEGGEFDWENLAWRSQS